ncbi:cyanovirin-n family protein [Venturia nashicola]|uniref:Cyanovirin-n family protein n=1 Tax=Venturia nashicola TaxID=86259 RepID=A0A4Z1PJN7_9PEZI|nr:cyanovirin-n family protein [Venturia nashicola]TLD37939.1 cyanovirin-n family protein [Venturia nashicola]
MSFALSAENVRVDDGHILRAALRNGNGDNVDAEIDLDQLIGNDNGNFYWGGSGFSGSCQNCSFSIEGADAVPVLRAELRDQEGNFQARDINLAERIGNNNGQFVFN